jgi:putative tryptophan/tyrosine transport system substrate-binding protein
MRRREFITFLGGAAASWPLAAGAQQPERMRRIGVVMGIAEADVQSVPLIAAFQRALLEHGWVDGRNIRVEYHWAGSDIERMRAIAKGLVESKPDAIVAHTTQVVTALQKEARSIPIVFVVVSDPIGSGFVDSLPKPGGNITGFVNFEASLGGKWIELLREAVPHLSHAALMFNPDTAPYADYYKQPFEAAARALGVRPATAPVRNAGDIDNVIVAAAREPDGALVVMPDVFLARNENFKLIFARALQHRLPTISAFRYMTAAGGLLSYGIDNSDLFRRVPTYVDRILKGARPADLPVQLPIKFELAINVKTAKSLRLDVPPMLLARADEVIE